jgi:predicted ATPase/DNA-binding SARP family transcriptional activator
LRLLPTRLAVRFLGETMLDRRDPPPDTTLQLHLLGGFRVVAAGYMVPDDAWRLRKARALVKLLALAPDTRLMREEIRELLWPDLDPAAADNNLRGALLVARRALAPAGAIIARAGTLALHTATGITLQIDSVAFEHAAHAARRTRDAGAYAHALDLYVGELLPEDRYEDWTLAPRERLRALSLTLLGELAALHEAAGDWSGAIVALQRVILAEPSYEEAHTGLMRLFASAGQRTRALAQWDTLVSALQRDLDTTPSAAAHGLREEIAAGRFPPVTPQANGARPGRDRGNLPLPLTALIGREVALVAVKEALAGARLVTLVGAGGSGKTRLALAAATDLLAVYPDGVWLVELATLDDPALVPQAIATALGVRAGLGRTLLEALAEALRERTLLLVLDNAEHLRAACATIAASLLAVSPGLRVLTTSRVPLGVPGETVWRVPTLDVPHEEAGAGPHTLAAIAASPAVRLFVERARSRQPAFALTAANAAAVAAICRRLDGIPLALELAAARVAVLPVAVLESRLDDALALLDDGGRAGLPRHRTLRATLDWSHDLLSPAQQRLFAHLGLFVGGSTLAAIEAVSGATATAATTLLNDLGELIAHSLVAVIDDDTGVRYALPEATRQYAVARLAAAPDLATMRARHADYYAALALGAEEGFVGAEHQRWVQFYAQERGNLRAALAWFATCADPAPGLRLAAQLWRYWDLRGEHAEGRRWCAHFLTQVDARGQTLPPETAALALFAVARLAYEQGDAAETLIWATRLLQVARADATIDAAPALTLLGHLAHARGDWPAARAAYSESLALRRATGNDRGILISLSSLVSSALAMGDYAAAEAAGAETLHLAQGSGDQETRILTLIALGTIARERQRPAEAVAYYDEALTLARALAVPFSLAAALAVRADLATTEGDITHARVWLREAIATLARHDRLPILRDHLEKCAQLAAACGQYTVVLHLGGAASALGDTLGFVPPPALRERDAALLAAARAALGLAAADRDWRVGLSRTPAAALAEAWAFLDTAH